MLQTIRETPAPLSETEDGLALVREHLDKALRIGMVRGVVIFVGHAAPWSEPEGLLADLARACIAQDILVVAADRAVRALDAAGLFADTGLEAAGSGLVEFCTLCDLPPVVACLGRDLGPVLALCARLAETFGVTADRLPVTACGQDKPDPDAAGLVFLSAPLSLAETDPVAAADLFSRQITARRLALGLNDRFDGSVYS